MEALTTNIDVLRSSTVGATSTRKTSASKGDVEKTAKDFEAVFMAQMLKPMWDGIETDGMFGGGPGEDVMRDLLVQEYGKAMVRNDRHGLSPDIMNAMIRMQDASNASAL